ncbi:MAG: phage major capsid protein [Alphaproteobacteria bacterium]
MASPNLSELVTTTLRSRTKRLADNVTKSTALLDRLNRRGKVKPVSGGRTIVQELEYDENSTFMRYGGYEALNISPSDVFSAAEYDWKQASVAVTISGLEQIQNAGPEAIIDLLESRIGNAEKTMHNNIGADCYSDGTADGGKQIGGMQLLVSDAPGSDVVGGIPASTWTFWRNVAFDATTDGGAPASAANIQSYMNQVWVQLVRNSDKPDLIVADNNYWRHYLESLQAIQRIQSVSEASAGFSSLKYMTADVVLDGGFGGSAPTNKMYFLNTDYLFYRPSRDRNMSVEDGERVPVNQDAITRLIFFAGNMTTSNRSLQGVLKD